MRVIATHVLEVFNTNFCVKLEKNLQGYIALMATIVIGAVLLVLTVSITTFGSRARFTLLGIEAKEQSETLAKGCAQRVLGEFIANPAYQGDATTSVAMGTCYVFPIAVHVPSVGFVTLSVQGKVRDSVTNLELQFDMHDIRIDEVATSPLNTPLSPLPSFDSELISWKEIPSLP